MLPPAPVTFSTTTGLPHEAPSFSAASRAEMSGATPGEKPTRIFTACSGYPCANACVATHRTAAATSLTALSPARLLEHHAIAIMILEGPSPLPPVWIKRLDFGEPRGQHGLARRAPFGGPRYVENDQVFLCGRWRD